MQMLFKITSIRSPSDAKRKIGRPVDLLVSPACLRRPSPRSSDAPPPAPRSLEHARRRQRHPRRRRRSSRSRRWPGSAGRRRIRSTTTGSTGEPARRRPARPAQKFCEDTVSNRNVKRRFARYLRNIFIEAPRGARVAGRACEARMPFTRAAADSFCEPNFSEKGTDDRQAGQADTWTQRRARALRSGWTDRNAADRSLKSINGTDGCGQTGRRTPRLVAVGP